MSNDASHLKLEIDAATIEAWSKRYTTEIATAKTDEEELLRIRDLITRGQNGYTWTETGDDVQIGRRSWDVSTVRGAAGDTGIGANALADVDKNKKAMLGFLAVFILILLGVGYWILAPLFGGNKASAQTIEGTAASLNPLSVLGGATATAPPPIALETGNRSMPLEAPRSVEFHGQALQIVAGTVKDNGRLDYSTGLEDKQQAVWFASPVNLLLGMSANRVNSLKIGDLIITRTVTGRVSRFVVDKVQEVQPQEIETLAQRRPGLTIFPLPSLSTPIHLVSASYDPANEQPDTRYANANLGEALTINGGTVTITRATVDEVVSGSYRITVYGETKTQLHAPALDVAGQLYPSDESIGPGKFEIGFSVPKPGETQLLVEGKRINLGALQSPALVATITAVRFGEAEFEVDLLITVSGGQAWARPSDFVLLTGASGSQSELAPAAMQPVNVIPGQEVELTVRFPRPNKKKAVNLRLVNELWEIALP